MKITALLGALLVALFAIASTAPADIILGHGNFNGTLYSIDTVAQTVTAIGTSAGLREGPEIQYDSTNSSIYMSVIAGTPLDLIDPTTGQTTGTLPVAPYPTGRNRITAMETVGSTLFASFSAGAMRSEPGILATIDTTTGTVTEIGALTGMDAPAGGLHFVNGTMYAITSTFSGSALFTVDTGSGAATFVGDLTFGGSPMNALSALAFGDGKMYTLQSTDTNLYSIDLATGDLTLEFDMGVGMNSLTSLTVIPEPAAAGVIGLFCIAAGSRRRR